MSLNIFFNPRTLKETISRTEETKILLVIGLSRSGTSLVQNLFNTDPNFFITYESIYMPFFGKNNKKDIISYYYEVLKQSYYINQTFSDDTPPSKKLPFQFEYKYFGDKVIYNNSNEFRNNLANSFSNEDVDKIVFIYRNPFARTSSLMKWYVNRDIIYPNTRDNIELSERIANELIKWNQFVEDILIFSQKEKCKIIDYDSLIKNPHKTTDSVFEFLETAKDIKTEKFLSTINSSSLDKWKDNLDVQIVKSIEEICKLNLQLINEYFELNNE